MELNSTKVKVATHAPNNLPIPAIAIGGMDKLLEACVNSNLGGMKIHSSEKEERMGNSYIFLIACSQENRQAVSIRKIWEILPLKIPFFPSPSYGNIWTSITQLPFEIYTFDSESTQVTESSHNSLFCNLEEKKCQLLRCRFARMSLVKRRLLIEMLLYTRLLCLQAYFEGKLLKQNYYKKLDGI